MKKTIRTAGAERGFTLLEMMIVVLILMIVTGAIFAQIANVQKRYRTEEDKLDLTQSSREAVDEFIRDVHQAGYPNSRMYAPGVLTAPVANDSRTAVGLVAVSSRDVWFEGDVNADGTVDSVRYQLVAQADGTCPCALRRSQQAKLNATAPTSQNVAWTSQLDNVVNSGSAGGALTISGTMNYGGTAVTSNVAYGAYATAPVFTFYNSAGGTVTVPADLAGGNLATGSAATLLTQVRSVRITLNVLSPYMDQQSRMRPAVTVSAVAKLNN